MASSTEDVLSRDLSLWLLAFGPLPEVILVTLLHCQPSFPFSPHSAGGCHLLPPTLTKWDRKLPLAGGGRSRCVLGSHPAWPMPLRPPPALIDLIMYFPQCGLMNIHLECGVAVR